MTWLLCALALPVALVVDALLDRQPWAWRLVRDTGVHRYFEHPDGRRRVTRVGCAHQPIDRQWLAGGEWMAPPVLGQRPPRPFNKHDRTMERQWRELEVLRKKKRLEALNPGQESHERLQTELGFDLVRVRLEDQMRAGEAVESGRRVGPTVPSRPWVSAPPRTGVRIVKRAD